jgi:hypothetical protein
MPGRWRLDPGTPEDGRLGEVGSFVFEDGAESDDEDGDAGCGILWSSRQWQVQRGGALVDGDGMAVDELQGWSGKKRRRRDGRSSGEAEALLGMMDIDAALRGQGADVSARRQSAGSPYYVSLSEALGQSPEDLSDSNAGVPGLRSPTLQQGAFLSAESIDLPTSPAFSDADFEALVDFDHNFEMACTSPAPPLADFSSPITSFSFITQPRPALLPHRQKRRRRRSSSHSTSSSCQVPLSDISSPSWSITPAFDQTFTHPLSGLSVVMGYNTSLPKSRLDMYITALRQLALSASEVGLLRWVDVSVHRVSVLALLVGES